MTEPLFEYPFTLRLHDTDAAGVIYFARLLDRAHEAYEAFLESAGLPLNNWLGQGPQLPLVHAEADFLAPIRLGRQVRVKLWATEVGRTSFTLDYAFTGEGGEKLARARTVHVAMQQGECVTLPDGLRAVLQNPGQ